MRYSATIELMKQKGFDFKYSFATDEEQEEYQNNYDEVYSECNQMLFTGGYRIYTTIDMGIQDLLQSSLDENLSDSQKKAMMESINSREVQPVSIIVRDMWWRLSAEEHRRIIRDIL